MQTASTIMTEPVEEEVPQEKTEEDFRAFLRNQYSSKVFLLIVLGNTWLNLAIFQNPGDYTVFFNSSWWDATLAALRIAVLFFPLYIWMVKTDRHEAQLFDEDSSSVKESSTLLPCIQVAFPVVLAFLFVVKIIDETPGPETLARDWKILPYHGLSLLPIITFFLLRDTRIEAMVITWGAALVLNLHLCISAQSWDIGYSLVLYGSVTGFVFFDATRQQKRMFLLMTKLQDTLKVNEKLAVEAQALELRAMIGNVAHDLKTPLTALTSSIEYIHDVLSNMLTGFHGHKHFLPVDHIDLVLGNFNLLRNCINSIRGTNSFMTMTINRCLDYTKASKGFKLVPKLETVSLQAALEMPVQLMRDVQDTIEIQVLPLSAEVCLHVITDKQWLIENLLCLLSNAVKYSHKGCVQVSIRLDNATKTSTVEDKSPIAAGVEDKDEDQQQMLRVEVQDTGIGLSDEAQKSLFNPFKQAQRLAGGTGLGLFSLAKRVEALQGQYGVSGRPDGKPGSLFWFTIPFRPDNTACLWNISRCDSSDLPSGSPTGSSSRKRSDSTNPSSRALEPRKFHLLVVDDAPLIVKMTTMLLQRKGHTVQHAVNGADALEKLLVRAESVDEEPEAGLDGSPRSSAQEMPAPPQFDVVLMDLQMPVLDGIEAIRRLRAAEARRDKGRKRIETASVADGVGVGGSGTGSGDEAGPPVRQCVIALSANSDEETRQEALAAGADLFLPKPFTYENFIDAVVNSLN